MQDICDVLKRECGDLYQKNVTIVRTVDGKFAHMPWKEAYELEQVADGYCVFHNWSLEFLDYATLYRDKKGKLYAAAGWSHLPSDLPKPTKPIKIIPIYFEQLSSEEAVKLIHEAFSKKIEREQKIDKQMIALRKFS